MVGSARHSSRKLQRINRFFTPHIALLTFIIAKYVV